MANEEHLAILRQGVEVWNAWRKEHPHVELDLRGKSLWRANLQGANLSGANLQQANLQGANLSGASLQGSDLEETELNWANLEGVNLAGANLAGAYLQGANLNWANLTGANFQRAWLAEANLRRADLWRGQLQGVNLTEADLIAANLRNANLTKANLAGANLQGANLTEANLQGANLQRANLNWANLTGANLQQASLLDVWIAHATFGDLELRGVQGLDTMQHSGPSTLGIDTLYRSEGNISEIFLRGCGVPEPMIEYARSLVAAKNPIQFYSCFISYSHADKPFARRLHNDLQELGIRCWLDEYQLLPGHSIYDEVDRGIRLWDKILLCASEHSLKSWWVDTEIDKAFVKEQMLMKQRGAKIRALVPLNLDDTLWHWQDGKADEVRSRLAADFTGWEQDNAKFESEFEKLVRALRTDEGREVPPPSRL